MRSIDIGCASVAPNHFNRCKTPIKIWELTLAGAAVVVSPTLYEQAVTDEQDGLIAESAADWTRALLRLVDDCDLRRRLQRAQRRRIATDHALKNHVLDWPRAWTQIIEHFRTHQLAA
jgi:glycosyltransferase involved in cell wall biosynthesis